MKPRISIAGVVCIPCIAVVAIALDWSAPLVVPGQPSSVVTIDGFGGRRSMAFDVHGVLHIAWSFGSQAYYWQYDPRNQTWSEPFRFADGSGIATHRSIAVDSQGNVHVVWEEVPDRDFEVYYRRKTPGSVAVGWGDPQRLTYAPAGSETWGFPRTATMAVDSSDRVHVAWMDSRFHLATNKRNAPVNFEIMRRVWEWEGENFSPGNEIRVTDAPGTSTYPVLRADGVGNVHLVWRDVVDNADGEMYYTHWRDYGAHAAPTMVSTLGGLSLGDGRFATHDETGGSVSLHFVWNDAYSPELPLNNLLYRRATLSPSGAIAWDNPVPLVPGDAAPRGAHIEVDSAGKVHLVWVDGRHTVRVKNKSYSVPEFYYGVWDDPTFTEERLTDHTVLDRINWGPTLLLDAAGRPHVLYVDFDAEDHTRLFYTAKTGG